MNLPLAQLPLFKEDIECLPDKKLLINTINAHSYNMAQDDEIFAQALQSSDVLLPDGVSIVLAKRLLYGERIKKIAGADLFFYEMKKLNRSRGKCFFLGSSNETLAVITDKLKKQYPNVKVECYSPPYVPEFSKKDNIKMITAVNQFKPDVLFIGMTAPKQEKWAFSHFNELQAGHICSIGAVFDFFAGSVRRAPKWMIKLGLEWLFRLLKEPRRLWRRYIFGNIQFISLIIREKFSQRL
ncbi:MAG: WecB/TagA/CpsF family glycosyltransferase [Bacteroidota bacterium]